MYKLDSRCLMDHKIEGCAQEALAWDENRNSYQGLAGMTFALLFIGGVWGNGIQHMLSIDKLI